MTAITPANASEYVKRMLDMVLEKKHYVGLASEVIFFITCLQVVLLLLRAFCAMGVGGGRIYLSCLLDVVKPPTQQYIDKYSSSLKRSAYLKITTIAVTVLQIL